MEKSGEEAGLRAAFRDGTPAAVRAGLRHAMVLAVGVLPLFVALDWLTHPQHAPTFLALRLADAAVQLTLLFLLSRPDGERRVSVIGLVGPASASIATNLMAALDGGPASSYSVGTILIILITAILVPFGPARMLLVGVVVSATGMACELLGAGGAELHAVVSNLGAFGVSTAIAVACAGLRTRARWRAFRDRRALADHARLLEAIRHAQSQFIADADPTVLFHELLDTLLGVTASEYGFIADALHHEDGRPFLQCRAITNIAWNEETRRLYEATQTTGLRFENMDTLFGAVVTTGKPVIANDPATDPRRGGLPAGHKALDTFLGLPLFHGSAMVGIAGVANRAGGYDHALVERLAPLAGTIAGLMFAQRNEHARRQAEVAVAEHAEVAAALARVGQHLIASLDTPVVLERLCQVTAEVLGCNSSHTLLWQAREDGFVAVAAHGAAVEPAVIRKPIPRELLARLLAELEDADVVEVQHERVSAFIRTTHMAVDRPPATRLCLALRRGRDVVGIQVANRHAPRTPFAARERRIAEGIAQLASMALANARLVEELEHASRLKTEFVSTMSHELRTPLNVILGFTEMLRDPGFDAPAKTGFVETIEQAGRELLALIESTLEIGRIEAGRQQVRLQTIALPPFWRELEASCGMLPHAHTVSLDWSSAPPDLSLTTDPHKLAIVVRNLVGNALKFTERGAVAVHVVRDGTDVLRFRVRDTGIGIAPADHATIFEMFRQADGSNTRRFGGTGLGLYIVRRFVELLGGRVTLDSTPGGGSTFEVTIPIAGPSAARARAA